MQLDVVHAPRPDQISEESGIDNETDKELKNDTYDELQTFVFSATLSKELQINLKKGSCKSSTKRYKHPASTLGESQLHFPYRLI